MFEILLQNEENTDSLRTYGIACGIVWNHTEFTDPGIPWYREMFKVLQEEVFINFEKFIKLVNYNHENVDK